MRLHRATQSLIFYLSDNGGAKRNLSNNSPLRDYKQSCYEGGIRVPFIVSWPERLKTSLCREPVISLDIMPTICAAVGIALPTDRIYDGRDLLPILCEKANVPLHEQLFWDGNDGHWAVREKRWKFVFSKKRNLELYDLNADIGETNNLTQQHPDIARRLEKKYLAWRNEMA